MANKSRLFQFTQAQLNAYIKDENSCVKCVPSKMHIGFPPWGLDNFKDSLLSIISKKKIGAYDAESRGIVLDVRSIKVEGTSSMIRYDSPELHLNIHAKFYVFQPHLGALLKGTVKHISKRHVSALIYNVFNVSIRLNGDFKRKLQVNKEISFRVKNFDLQNQLPYIEGELVAGEESGDSGISGEGGNSKAANKKKVFADNSGASSSSSDSEEEKVFQNLVVKTESQTSSKSTSKAAASSSSDSDSSDDDEDEGEEEKKKKAPVALPKPLVKQERVKKEKPTAFKAVASSSSSDESSDDEPSVPAPLIVKKESNGKTQPQKKPSASSSSDDSSSEDEADRAAKMPPSQFHTPRPIVVKQESSSSSAESSSSDEEDFKIPMPKLTQVGGEIVIKREMTPSRRVKRESTSSSTSEPEAKKVASVKKKVLQSPVEELPSPPEFPVAEKTPTKAKKTAAAKEKPVPLPSPKVVVTVKQEKPESAKKSANKKKDPPAAVELPKPVIEVKKENGKKMRVSFAPDSIIAPVAVASPKKTKASKSKESTPAKKAKKLAPTQDSSSDDEDDKLGSVNLSNSIQALANQIYTSKVTSDTESSKTPKAGRKRKATDAGDEQPSEEKKNKKQKKEPAANKRHSVLLAEADLSRLFDNDILSSTRLDSASPAPKPKKTKKSKE